MKYYNFSIELKKIIVTTIVIKFKLKIDSIKKPSLGSY